MAQGSRSRSIPPGTAGLSVTVARTVSWGPAWAHFVETVSMPPVGLWGGGGGPSAAALLGSCPVSPPSAVTVLPQSGLLL